MNFPERTLRAIANEDLRSFADGYLNRIASNVQQGDNEAFQLIEDISNEVSSWIEPLLRLADIIEQLCTQPCPSSVATDFSESTEKLMTNIYISFDGITEKARALESHGDSVKEWARYIPYDLNNIMDVIEFTLSDFEEYH